MKHSKLSSSLLSLFLAASACKNRDWNAGADTNVARGSDVQADSDLLARSTVAIVDAQDGKSFCTGTYIQPNVVLSAAHCFHGVENNPYFVTFGRKAPKDTASLQSFAGKLKVKKVVVHPDYFPAPPITRSRPTGPEGVRWSEQGKDFALVFFEGSAPQSAIVPSIPGPNDLPLRAGNKVIVAGFGLTAPGASDGGTLRTAELTVEDLRTPEQGEAEILASNPSGADACYGDSGGPLYVSLNGGQRLALVGVVSASRDRFRVGDNCRIGTLFGDARHMRTWIAQTVRTVLGR